MFIKTVFFKDEKKIMQLFSNWKCVYLHIFLWPNIQKFQVKMERIIFSVIHCTEYSFFHDLPYESQYRQSSGWRIGRIVA
jgi:hypothetical protein